MDRAAIHEHLKREREILDEPIIPFEDEKIISQSGWTLPNGLKITFTVGRLK